MIQSQSLYSFQAGKRNKTYNFTITQPPLNYTPQKAKKDFAVILDGVGIFTLFTINKHGLRRVLKPIGRGGIRYKIDAFLQTSVQGKNKGHLETTVKAETIYKEVTKLSCSGSIYVNSHNIRANSARSINKQKWTKAEKKAARFAQKLANYNENGGVYAITWTNDSGEYIDGYIGSTVSFKKRCRQHDAQLKKSVHSNAEMQRVFDDSSFRVQEPCLIIHMPKLTQSIEDCVLYESALRVVEELFIRKNRFVCEVSNLRAAKKTDVIGFRFIADQYLARLDELGVNNYHIKARINGLFLSVSRLQNMLIASLKEAA